MAVCESVAPTEELSAPVRVAVSLGSNMGDRAANLRLGVAGLAEFQDELRCSGVFETQPMYVVEQAPFLNACCTGRTRLTARQLLEALQGLEQRAGRQPGGRRYGARPLDLDLLLYGAGVIEEPDFVVPHPRLRERPFVLAPLAELASDWALPASGGHALTTVGELFRKAGEEGIVRTNIQLCPV